MLIDIQSLSVLLTEVCSIVCRVHAIYIMLKTFVGGVRSSSTVVTFFLNKQFVYSFATPLKPVGPVE
jgi:hypothetical protein